MTPVEPRNRQNGAWKLKDDEKTCNNAGVSQNPEKQPTLVMGKNPNGKSRFDKYLSNYD
jgi:hypothetical protein